MLSKSAARKFFLVGTVLCSASFVLLTIDTIRRVPAQTNAHNLTPSAIRGKHLFDKNNCMGCHTILGEGAYYAPELTKVYDRRGPQFIKAMLKDPQAMYPGKRKMQQYNFTEEQMDDFVNFFKWIGEMDLNGFPPNRPDTSSNAQSNSQSPTATLISQSGQSLEQPTIFSQMCTACHSLGGKGGNVGPALDQIGNTRTKEFLVSWIKNPLEIKPDSKMPKLPLSDNDIDALATYLSQMKGGVK